MLHLSIGFHRLGNQIKLMHLRVLDLGLNLDWGLNLHALICLSVGLLKLGNLHVIGAQNG